MLIAETKSHVLFEVFLAACWVEGVCQEVNLLIIRLPAILWRSCDDLLDPSMFNLAAMFVQMTIIVRTRSSVAACDSKALVVICRAIR